MRLASPNVSCHTATRPPLPRWATTGNAFVVFATEGNDTRWLVHDRAPSTERANFTPPSKVE